MVLYRSNAILNKNKYKASHSRFTCKSKYLKLEILALKIIDYKSIEKFKFKASMTIPDLD